ncbi:uncharacterized protein PHACADRAFT_213078 [Phanerochaete carnosa HHB-10118-sp]|uniref:Glucose-methanol-choline oxidoreductase N-terminal domain-containing protein n=1 Tax=Phanerochaete carnosa (strain HHB-10118-sp) TaxID=650164 RepID=K5VIU3_PHACS|nr:uncharacterized protein PHACADRAFT_213078 [Phanerochaete carnosa HHB-10118-sp]EKM51208.1 hypothetical protein PHACADRAFT_213078 [Phanerochaete carnosa HHB-10118-sp]
MASPSLDEYDVIFAGAGTSGGVAAGRLAAADPSLKILLIEAGPHVREDDNFVQPAKCLSHLRPDNPIWKVHVSNVSEYLGGRSQIVTCPHVVGGSSSVNFTLYNRAVASDFDDWEQVHKNPGWGAKDLVPLLRKTETYQVAPGKDDIHGYSGPLKVSYGGKFTNVGRDFLDVAKGFDTAREHSDDPNNIYVSNVYGRMQKWIDGMTGKRSDVAHHYLYNHTNTTGLEILTGSLVKRVIFEGKRAVGVEYVPNPVFQPDADKTQVRTVRAKKLVVICAGTFGSPGILERSGIGAKDVLGKAGVPQIVDLPGVGEHYQDHSTLFPPYLATADSFTLDGIGRGDPEETAMWHQQWVKDGQGMMAHNGMDAGIKWRPNEEELKEIGPEFEQRWKEYFADKPDKPVFYFCPLSMFVGDPSSVPPRKYFCLGYFPAYPKGMGHVHINSGDDVHAALDFETAYCRAPEDMALLKYGYKLTREYARRMPCYEGEYTPHHPLFPSGSATLCAQNVAPVSVDAPRLVYTKEDDKALEAHLRKFVVTAWHFMGTCAMKPREQGGVVDCNLNVWGVEGLKVCDLSVPPSNVCANTYSTALLVGEKGAVIIGNELGIKA